MKFLRVDHIDLVVSDLQKSIEFYRKFGMHPEGTLDAGKTVFMFNGDDLNPVRIELHQAKPGDKTGLDHISFAVEDPVDATKEIEYLGGVNFKFKPFENRQSGRTISNCVDPDGILIQMCKKTSPGTYKNWE
jgi:catechol 2,3-dioxygenase-like lactoylglutathione lyase family enzyme